MCDSPTPDNMALKFKPTSSSGAPPKKQPWPSVPTLGKNWLW